MIWCEIVPLDLNPVANGTDDWRVEYMSHPRPRVPPAANSGVSQQRQEIRGTKSQGLGGRRHCCWRQRTEGRHGFFTDLYSIIGSKSNFTIIIFLLSGVVLLPRALYEVCECRMLCSAPTCTNTAKQPLCICAGRGREGWWGAPSLQRRGVSSLKQQNSSADTHRRSLHWHCYIYLSVQNSTS